MSQALLSDETPVYDLVGVGFGPSNLALAIAVTEYNAQAADGDALTAHFLERQPEFGWHRGMLIDDATMQVSFLKDLVTLRNPASEFSFLCYLQSKGRLVDFVNHKTLFPLRAEFHDYFEWAAARVDDQVTYGHEVVAVRPVYARDTGDTGDEVVAYFEVESRTGVGMRETVSWRARNLVVATGLRPNLPEGVTRGERVWHNSELLHRVAHLEQDTPSRFVVVGAGQSAAEVTAFLHDRFAEAEVCSVFTRYGYSPSDDSPFANRIFDPDAVDAFYLAPEEVKQRLLGYHGNTNYSVVDLELIDDLYRRMYREKVLGTERLRLFNVCRPVEVVQTATGVRATVESLATGERTVLEAGVVVYATGYLSGDPLAELGELGPYCLRDEQGRAQVDRDYRVRTAPEVRAGVYLQGGGTEHSHGITSSLLSNNAVRAGEILRSITDRVSPRAKGVTRVRPRYAVSGTVSG
ncbi:lysine N(6)-hydroxylase/L-ornithine N(5)-oxygenase family protein [Amycolatopsis cihanbeyliensis]|uniref:L-lysine N6-monooxygenase MbtG n=1 Tax=Amycolatopsis cihanbeyliensis TaxID=1128664 RepID=A0A542DCU5_AMYCI|nr:lysine N(6)-hydroxylase/L-ornithine N(5)-oxygenase family protein [Amycolatopsis cihanbeyliensis]TQJ00883.1 L-ornithine N5-oxygenase [Amycolatopsis cihanbeyliensis]